MDEKLLYSIGEFSRLVGLTVKALRFYHDEGLLVPARIDPGSSYRYYDQHNLERARLLAELRKLEFPLEEIAQLLKAYEAEANAEEDLISFFRRHRERLAGQAAHFRGLVNTLDNVIKQELEVQRTMITTPTKVELKDLPGTLVAGYRMKGKYSDIGKGFGKVAKAYYRQLAGTPLGLFYDHEYREGDADFEACFPVKSGSSKGECTVHELPAGSFLTLTHVGPYDQLGRTYEKLLNYAKEKKLEIDVPSREVYHKGPGMIFRGNPKKYVTEVQVPVKLK